MFNAVRDNCQSLSLAVSSIRRTFSLPDHPICNTHSSAICCRGHTWLYNCKNSLQSASMPEYFSFVRILLFQSILSFYRERRDIEKVRRWSHESYDSPTWGENGALSDKWSAMFHQTLVQMMPNKQHLNISNLQFPLYEKSWLIDDESTIVRTYLLNPTFVPSITLRLPIESLAWVSVRETSVAHHSLLTLGHWSTRDP